MVGENETGGKGGKQDQVALSVDVDYFVEPTVTYPCGDQRPSDIDYSVAPATEVTALLEAAFGLSESSPGRGVGADEHSALFGLLRDLIDAGELVPPFTIIHIDAHWDMGMGDTSFRTIMSDLLTRSPAQRASNLPSGSSGIQPGNWLAFSIACRWAHRVIFPQRKNELEDVPAFYQAPSFNDDGTLLLKPMTKQEVDRMLGGDTARTN